MLANRLLAIATTVNLCCVVPSALGQSSSLVSVSTSGVQGNEASGSSSMSADGSAVAFSSDANTLVTGDTNTALDVFVRDVPSSVTIRVSVDDNGGQGNGHSAAPSISGDGRYVAFASSASNLVPGDTNNQQDVFVHDRVLSTTRRVSVSSSGAQGNASSSFPAFSSYGRYVAFSSIASNLILGDTNSKADIFVHDMLTGVTTRVSVDDSGNQSNGDSSGPSLSADGRFVAFESYASNLVTNDTQGFGDVFVYDQFSATIRRASVSSSGLGGNGVAGDAGISGDGQLVVFTSTASNLIAGDTNNATDIYLRNLALGTTQRISMRSSGAQPSASSLQPAISRDGRYVAYYSVDQIIPGPSGQLFRYDLQSGSVLRVGTASGGLPSAGQVTEPALSADGSLLCFQCTADDVVPGDINLRGDVFCSDLSGPPYLEYCFGDGTSTPCPCGNASLVGQNSGCTNSTGLAAQLSGSGVPSVSTDTLAIIGTGMPVGGPCLYYQGTALFGSGFGAVFGDGLRCAGGAIVRFQVVFNSLAGSTYPAGALPSISTAGACTVGITRTYQGWYRDSAAFCAPETFNLTNGLALSWRP